MDAGATRVSADRLHDVVRRLTGVPARRVVRNIVELDDGRQLLAKRAAVPSTILAEVAGLCWLAQPATIAVPKIFGHDEQWLLLEYLPPATPTREAAIRFGQGLAQLHAAGAPAFGAPPPGGPTEAWIGRAPMRNAKGTDWPSWYAEHRVLPYMRTARDRGDLTNAEARTIETACAAFPNAAGPAVLPARLHGDLWSGNVCWSAVPSDGSTSAWLIDPAAHGGHPETDLAMLALFGCPYLDQVIVGYQQISPLPHGWHARVGLHQLFPLLVHVVLFGRSYAPSAVTAARSTLDAAERIP